MPVGDVALLLAILEALQQAADVLKTHERSLSSKIFFGDLKARCLILHQDSSLVDESRFEADTDLIARIFNHLELVLTHEESSRRQYSCPAGSSRSRLHAFKQQWETAGSQEDDGPRHPASKLDIARFWLSTTPYDRRSFIQPLDAYANEIRGRHLEAAPDLTQDDLPAHIRIKRPPHSVCTAAQSIFNALMSCKTCKCKSPHEFDARFRLGTYRKLELDPNLIDFELNFETFLSWERDWQEVHIRATAETKHRSAVQFVISDGNPVRGKPTRGDETRMVKRLCKHIKGMRNIATYRLELKVNQGKLFQLEPTRSTSLVDKTKKAVSLEQVLERPDAISARAKYILSVLLSSAVLHLHGTPWLKPTWGSSHVLFFHTTSSQLPLRPYMQTELSQRELQQALGTCSPSRDCIEKPGDGDGGSDDDDSDSSISDDSDDFNLSSFMRHQCPTVVSLAAVLMELYSGKPFRRLAEDYGVPWDKIMSSSTGVRYLNICEVFEKWKEEVPENTQFLSAVEKCLDRQLWENEEGQPLESEELRTKVYDEVVKRLEIELSQAFSKTSIDELDEKAAELDFGNWDQMISPAWGSLPHWTAGRVSDCGNTRTPSPQPPVEYVTDAQIYSVTSTTERTTTPETDCRSMRFFDNGDVTKGSPEEARRRYLIWKSDYLAVYKRFIPKDLSNSRSGPVKVAILDTGIDMNHQDVGAREENIKGRHNWLNEKRARSVPDRNGHGTFTACLLLDYAPDVELYVAKIADSDPTGPSVIAKAIDHAVSNWKVDIISMSFGYPDKQREGYDELERALERAYSSHVLLFAAASNGGGRVQPSFPAREDTVIAVYSTDTDGDRSKFSPTAMAHELNLATVGEAVESAWLDDRVVPKSGTSYATPIMAGIAAFLLQYARIHMPGKESALKKRKGMMAVLKRIAQKGQGYQCRDGYYFVDISLRPDGLFGKEKALIEMIIGDVLDSS